MTYYTHARTHIINNYDVKRYVEAQKNICIYIYFIIHTLRVRTNIGAVRPTNYRPAGRPICSRFDRQGRSGSYAADAQQQRQYNMCVINNIMTRRTKNVYLYSFDRNRKYKKTSLY